MDDKKIKQSLKRYMASGSHCPIGFHLFIGCRDGAAALVGADDLWYHTGQLWIYVSPFLRFYISPFLRFSLSPSTGGLEGLWAIQTAILGV